MWCLQTGAESGFGRLGLKTIGFYTLTGFLAVCTGLLCVNLLNPGIVNEEIREKMLNSPSGVQTEKVDGAIDQADKGLQGLIEIFQRMVPPNLFKAAKEGQLLGLIFFGLLFGFFISRLKPEARETQTAFWESLNAVILSITKWIISFAPIGVFGLVTPTLMQVGLDTLSVMGKFALTVLMGLGIHALIVLPALLWILGKINFRNHYQAMAPALLTAFSTASSRHPPPSPWIAYASGLVCQIRLPASHSPLVLQLTWTEPPCSNVSWWYFSHSYLVWIWALSLNLL